MKNVRTLAIIACLSLNACGAKNDLDAEDAASALQALIETKSLYDDRQEDAATVTCSEGGQVIGLTKGHERYRAIKGVDYAVHLQNCQNRGIVMEGAITHNHEDTEAPHEAVSVKRYDGALFLRGHLQGSCDLHLVEYAFEGLRHETLRDKSTFCGHDIDALARLLRARNDEARKQNPAIQPSIAPMPADVDSVTETADVEIAQIGEEAPPPPLGPGSAAAE